MGLPVPQTLDEEDKNSNETKTSEQIAGPSVSPDNMPHSLPTAPPSIAEPALQDLENVLGKDTQVLIQETIAAFAASFGSPHAVKEVISAPDNPTQFVNMADCSVRRLVSMAKSLRCFQEICQEDQIILLKGSVVEVLIMMSSKYFNTGNKAWSVQCSLKDDTTNKPFDVQVNPELVQKSCGEGASMMQEYTCFVKNFQKNTCRDEIILLMLCMMAVFSDDRPALKDKKAVGDIQQRYADILKEYIEARYRCIPNMLASCIMLLAQLREVNEANSRMLLQVRVEELEPLLVEIFDLAAH